MKSDKIQTIIRTGTVIAVLTGVQWLTGFTEPFAGRYITDSCINFILVISVLTCGLWSGAAVAVLSPFCAFVLGIGPQLLQIIPAMALGNVILVMTGFVMLNREKPNFRQKAASVIVMSALKFLVLYVAVVKVLIPVMGPGLTEQQEKIFTAMFSLPQLLTALIGSMLAVCLMPLLRKKN